MKAQLKVLGNCINPVEIVISRRPARRGDVNPPAPFACPKILIGMAEERRPLLQVVPEGFGFMTFGGVPAGFQDAPPGYGAAVVAHHAPNLPGTAGSQQLGHIAVRECAPGRNQLNHRQHRLDVLNPHGSRLAAVALPGPVGAGR